MQTNIRMGGGHFSKKVRKKKRGFTLIELLAVIIILGVLMIIAIPSVTEYIQTSRKSSYATTATQYISGAKNKINSAEIPMYDTDTTYYLPASCISLESGGDSPFGEFEEAYIVVTYDGSGYDYYWTSRDSANMGVLLTSENLLDDDSILTGIENINTSIGVGEREYILLINDNCNGEGETKPAEVTIPEKSKADESIEDLAKPESELPMLNSMTAIMQSNDLPSFYQQLAQIRSITFEDKINIPEGVETYDFSSTKNGKVMSFLREHPTESGYYDLVIQGDGKIYANPDSSYLFSIFTNMTAINNIHLLNTSKVLNMSGMFSRVSKISSLDLSSWDTRNVTDMSYMFFLTGAYSEHFSLTLGFDTSNVTNMSHMFDVNDDYDSITATHQLYLGDKFDTSKVTDMENMFSGWGMLNDDFVLDLGDKFDTSKVTNMKLMFSVTGYLSNSYTLILGDKFNTSNVTNMERMFVNIGRNADTVSLNLGSKFNTGNVINMERMFSGAGLNAENWNLDCSSWNVDKVTNYNGFNYEVETKVIAPNWKH